MACARHPRHHCLCALAAFAISLLATQAAGDDASSATAETAALVGEYRHSTVTPAGKVRRSVATIGRHGAGLSLAWEEDEGNLFGGIGVSLDGVLGAAY